MQVNAVCVIPNSQLSGVGIEPEAAVILCLHKSCTVLNRVVPGKGSRKVHTRPVCVAAEAEHCVQILLRRRKSEGRVRHALRFINRPNRFRFGWEQA